jgi:YfiH family protein
VFDKMKQKGKKPVGIDEWMFIEKNNIKFYQFRSSHWIMNYSTIGTDDRFLDHFKPILLKQIHSNTIIDIDRTENRIGDGIITQKKNSILGIKIADCLPVFLFNEENMCMIHCGWRGIIKKIAQKAKTLMGEYKYVLGASIGPCCYEVGDDIAGFFKAQYKNAVIKRDKKSFIDIKTAVIEDLGKDRLIGNLDLCTKCHPEYFYSYRRGDMNKRNYSIAMQDMSEY